MSYNTPHWSHIEYQGLSAASFDRHREGARMNLRPCLEPWSHVTEKSLEDFGTVILAPSYALNPVFTLRHMGSQGLSSFTAEDKNPFHSVVPCEGEPFIHSRAHLGVRLPFDDRMLHLALPCSPGLKVMTTVLILRSSLYLLQQFSQTLSLPV